MDTTFPARNTPCLRPFGAAPAPFHESPSILAFYREITSGKRAKVKSGFKTYKGKHFGPVQTITGVSFYQGYPKYTLNNVKHTKMKQVTPLREELAAVRREMRQAQGAAKQKLKDKKKSKDKKKQKDKDKQKYKDKHQY